MREAKEQRGEDTMTECVVLCILCFSSNVSMQLYPGRLFPLFISPPSQFLFPPRRAFVFLIVTLICDECLNSGSCYVNSYIRKEKSWCAELRQTRKWLLSQSRLVSCFCASNKPSGSRIGWTMPSVFVLNRMIGGSRKKKREVQLVMWRCVKSPETKWMREGTGELRRRISLGSHTFIAFHFILLLSFVFLKTRARFI